MAGFNLPSIHIVYSLVNLVLLASGGAMGWVAYLIISQALRLSTQDTITEDLILAQLPLAGLIIVTALKTIAYLLIIPILAQSATQHSTAVNRWLAAHTFLSVCSLLTTLYLAVLIFAADQTIYTSLSAIWTSPIDLLQVQIQDRYTCCGWLAGIPPYAISIACPNARIAASQPGCVTLLGADVDSWLGWMWVWMLWGGCGVDAAVIAMDWVMRVWRREEIEMEGLRKKVELGWMNEYQRNSRRISGLSRIDGRLRNSYARRSGLTESLRRDARWQRWQQ